MVIAFAPSEKMWEKETVCVCVRERWEWTQFPYKEKVKTMWALSYVRSNWFVQTVFKQNQKYIQLNLWKQNQKKKDKKSPFLIVTSLHHQPSIFSLLHTSTYKSPKQPAQHLPLYIMTYLSCLYISTYLSCLYIFLAFFLFRCFDWSFCKSSLAFLGTANPLGEKKGSKI